MNDQQVLQAILNFYSEYGAGVDAHREIARFMRQNNIPVEQVARITGYAAQDVQADYDAFAQQQATQDALQQQEEQLRAQQAAQQAAERDRFAGLSPDVSAGIGSSLSPTEITIDQTAISNAMAQYEAQQAAQQAQAQMEAQQAAEAERLQRVVPDSPVITDSFGFDQRDQAAAREAAAQQAAQVQQQQAAAQQEAQQQAAQEAQRVAAQQAQAQEAQRVAAQQEQAQQAAQQQAEQLRAQQAAQQQAAQLAGDAQRAAQLASDQQPAQQQAAQQQTIVQQSAQQPTQQQGQTNMAMTDQQVLDAINTAYAQFGGAGFEAHRAIAQFMERNNVSPEQVASITGYTPDEVRAEFQAQTSPQAKQQQVQEFFQGNPNASDEQIFQYMQQANLQPEQVIQAMGLDSDDSMRRFRDQVINTAQPGQVTQEQLQAYFANNPNATDAEIYSNMQQFGVSPQQVSQALGMPFSEASTRFSNQQRNQMAEAIPTGLLGFEQSASQGLGDATQTLRGAETQSRGDIESALQSINQLYGVNIDDLRAAAAQASGQINTGFDQAGGFFQPFQQGGEQAFQQQLALSGALGQDAFNQAYQESPQIAFLREQGMRANLAGAAATGGLGGGNVQRELQRFGQGLASQGLQQQIANLGNLSGMGMQGAQGMAGLATGRAGALGDITLNNAQNIAAQRGDQASFIGQGGVNLANIGLQTGQNIGNMQFGTGRDIAQQRGRAGELLANQIQNVYGNQSNLLQNLGTNQANMIGNQANDLINMQNAAALRAQQNAINLGGGMANLETGLATNTANTITGQPAFQAPAPNYSGAAAGAFNAAAGGYDLANQYLMQTQTTPAPAFTSAPAYINPNTPGPLRGGFNPNQQPTNFGMPRGADNPFSNNYLGSLV